jgi:Protein of unknown function (DUF3365)
MNRLSCLCGLTLTICLLTIPETALSAVDSELEISSELTTLFRSARAVISKNQKHINDASVGDKGLTGEAVLEKALENYRSAKGYALDQSTATPAQKAMLASVKLVMADAQGLINEKGKGFKGFLPAIFARQVARSFSTTMEGKMKIKLTAPKSYVRNRANRPDKWESNVIESHFKNASYEKGKPYSEITEYKGRKAFRYILPEYYGPSCLGCHGEPKGELDITGGKKEGGKLNELGGAISLIILE